MPDPANGAQPEGTLTFEQAYAELEKTANALQQGQLSLDETLRLYERGSFLSRFCLERLDGVELKVTQLLARAGGAYTTKPIASEKDITPPEPALAESSEPSPAAANQGGDAYLKEQRELFD